MVAALLKEIELRKDYFGQEQVETIYFGGGTPSILNENDLQTQLDKIRSIYKVSENAEITLEANSDDIGPEALSKWKNTGINRLSIGVQSFFEEDLRWMNRAHSASQAVSSLRLAIQHFDNISIDLIYGTPFLTDEKWKQNVEHAIQLNIPHLSCYALTVEPKTPLQKMINMGKSPAIDPDKQSEQFLLLMDWLDHAGYEHYEISNFSKPGWRSHHNSSYWQGKKYLGIGPSAHSFNGTSRQWNIANNKTYIDSINNSALPFEKEELSSTQQLNEYIMTSLRTAEGIDLRKIDETKAKKIVSAGSNYIESGHMTRKDDFLILTREGKLLADGIAAKLFI